MKDLSYLTDHYDEKIEKVKKSMHLLTLFSTPTPTTDCPNGTAPSTRTTPPPTLSPQ